MGLNKGIFSLFHHSSSVLIKVLDVLVRFPRSMFPKGLFQAIEKGLFVLAVIFTFFSCPPPAEAYRILFYYNGSGVNGAVLRCAAILKNAGNQVDAVNVAGKNHNPENDNWGAPYDQVWDMRFINRDREECGHGSVQSADYFDEHWRSKAVSFLNHCGKLFIAGEHYQLADRNEGLYKFLKDIQAVSAGYDACPPSRGGNSSTGVEGFYPVRQGLGPVSFFGAYAGGIPLAYLNGTNFVNTENDWQGDDGVNRSLVSGWKGSQIGGEIDAPLCGRGKLFMVWDATMWTKWDFQVKEEAQRSVPIWDESAWFAWDPDAQEDREKGGLLRRAQTTTQKFFPAAVRWLGAGRDCPCETPARFPPVPRPSPLVRPMATAIAEAAPRPMAAARTDKGLAFSGPETIVFSEIPVNIYMRFLDGAGEYKVVVVDNRGNYLRTVFDKRIRAEKEAWTAWDGTREDGILMTLGVYEAVLSKDGRPLRKIILSWVAPIGKKHSNGVDR